MPNPQRILTMQFNDYQKNRKKSIYRKMFESYDIKEGKQNIIFNTLNKNIDNNNHPMVKKYPKIVAFIKNYKDCYDDAIELFFNDLMDYHHDVIDCDLFASLYDEMRDTVDHIKKLNIETIDRIRTNVNILIDKKISYDEANTELIRRYPPNKNPKLDAMYSLSIYLLDLYQRYNPPKFQFKFGQKEAYDIFKEKIKLPNYWGLMIAPTGWGKSMMHYLFMGCFFQNSKKNILLITKRKDILTDVIDEIKEEIRKLKEKKMFPDVRITVCDQVNNILDHKKINSCAEYSVVIINSDKLITRNKNDNKFNPAKLDRLNWDAFGLVIFDEVHWAGATRNVQFMNYLKSKIPYGIGSSATPIRKSLQNQENIQSLYGQNYQIMYELTYMDAWKNNVILKVDTVMFPIYPNNMKVAQPNNLNGTIHTNCVQDVDQETKHMIVNRIDELLNISYKKKVIMFFRSRLSLLQWYRYFTSKHLFNQMTYHMSITYSNQSDDVDEEERTTDAEVNRMITILKINKQEIQTGISRFKKQSDHAILMVVNRANEGFNDPPVDICVNLDFTKNSNMLVTLQRMGRAQRLIGDKMKGYYLCPVLVNDEEQFKDLYARSIYNYIDATTKNSVNGKEWKDMGVTKEVMTYILESFRTEGKTDYTHDDLMKRILRFVKERDMTLERFIEILKIYNVHDINTYNDVWSSDESFQDRGMPYFPDRINGFSWSMVNHTDYYDEKEIIEVVRALYRLHSKEIKKLNSNRKILDFLHNMDQRIPNQPLWEYYSFDKKTLSYIFD